MFVSGLTISSKAIAHQRERSSNKKRHHSKQTNQRPLSSSQLPDIYECQNKRKSQNSLYTNPYKLEPIAMKVRKTKLLSNPYSEQPRKLSSGKLQLKKRGTVEKVVSPNGRVIGEEKCQFVSNPIQAHSAVQKARKEMNSPSTSKFSGSTKLMHRDSEKVKTRKNNLNQNSQGSNLKSFNISSEEGTKIMKYFRYYPVVIIQACSKRQELMKSLLEEGDIEALNSGLSDNLSKLIKNTKSAPSDMQQSWSKLMKIALLKGKYKYREKFNFIYSAQLKALKWKRKEYKKKKDSSSSESDDDDKREKHRDMDAWKKSMGIDGGNKVFIIKGKYPDLKNALLERGWVQNPDKKSSYFDLKWTTKVNDIFFDSLKPNQVVNHFNNNACLTSKYGICKSLRSIMYTNEVDIDRFFPKAFDLTDISDFENFLEVYKWVYCQSLLKKFVNSLQEMNSKEENEERKQPQSLNLHLSEVKVNQLKLSIAIVSRRLSSASHLIKGTCHGKFNIASVREWELVSSNEKNLTEQDFNLCRNSFESWGLSNQSIDWEHLKLKVFQVLDRVSGFDPQFDIDGHHNIWIAKPAFLSRGRGIKCFNKLEQILDYTMGKDTQYVVQKYIENPLIINRRKSDIRLWVVVQDYNPPKIWIYGEFYVRFCMEDYDETKLSNKYAHLTNNSIQKYNKKLSQKELRDFIRKDSMWSQEQLKKYIQENYSHSGNEDEGDVFKRIQAKMKEIVISTVLSTADQVYGRKRSFELIGYDFMLDSGLNPWLIEINTSPAMDYSTSVTARLVKMVMEDMVKLMVDQPKKPNKKKTYGLFKCVYSAADASVYRPKYYRLETGQNQSKQQITKPPLQLKQSLFQTHQIECHPQAIENTSEQKSQTIQEKANQQSDSKSCDNLSDQE